MNVEEYEKMRVESHERAMKEPGNQPEDFDRLSREEKNQLLDWIVIRLRMRKSVNYNHSSYGLKHFFENDGGFYITNGMFKGAILSIGCYKISDKKKLNWNINISERSINELKKRNIWNC